MYQIDSYLSSVGVMGFSAESEKICGWETFKILNRIQGYLQKDPKIRH